MPDVAITRSITRAGLNPAWRWPVRVAATAEFQAGCCKRVTSLLTCSFTLGRQVGAALILFSALCLLPGTSYADAIAIKTPAGDHHTLPESLQIESDYSKNRLSGEVNGTLAYPYADVRRAIEEPAAWCDVLTLHLNVKACVYGSREDSEYLRVFGGTKEFEALEDAEEIEWTFVVVDEDDKRARIELSAPEGPLGTSNYRIEVTLEPGGDDETAVKFTYRYDLGYRARIATKGYLQTLARDKVGFTVDPSNREAGYIGGMRGLVERNVMRYYLALVAYFDSARDGVFSPARGAQHWFDLTARYPRQLAEVAREAYVEAKRREYAQQQALQKKLDAP